MFRPMYHFAQDFYFIHEFFALIFFDQALENDFNRSFRFGDSVLTLADFSICA